MREKSEDGIVVQGLSNCLVKFSKCCTPVPGDDIVGFITRGYGVSVHRADCPNAAPERRRPEEAGRWVKVSWGKDVKQSYQTSLDIYAKDRIDLVLDVSAVLSSTQTRVAASTPRPPRTASPSSISRSSSPTASSSPPSCAASIRSAA